MVAGLRIAGGTDLDNVFDPYVQGTKPAATGFRTSNGVDLNQRYAPLIYGTKAPATGFRTANGADLNTLFAKKGSAAYSLPINGRHYQSSALAKTNQAGTISASVSVGILSNGTYSVVANNTGGASPGATTLATGRWLPEGESVANYQVQFSMTTTGTATESNGAASYAACSTSRTCAITTSTGAATSVTATGYSTIDIQLRRTGGAVNLTRVNLQCAATGWK